MKMKWPINFFNPSISTEIPDLNFDLNLFLFHKSMLLFLEVRTIPSVFKLVWDEIWDEIEE